MSDRVRVALFWIFVAACVAGAIAYVRWRTLDASKAALDRAGFEILSRTPTFFFTVQAYDFKSPKSVYRMSRLWDRVTFPGIRRFPNLAGRLGYWSDRMLGAFLSEGPSFEMMICRKR